MHPRTNQLGKYQLVAEMARGGMGIVYLAVAQGPARFSKLLVVKELRPELVEDTSFLEMFLEEARLAARLSHPNIVQTYEISAGGTRPYIVMDYLDGVPLARILRRKSPKFTLGMHLRVISEMLSGLHYAHTLRDFDGTALGIVHRDISPQNVFITFDGTAKLVDFGIAKAHDSSIETRTGVLKGKPAYMAPEQIAGEIDARADIFSAGVMIWEAIAGQRMWGKRGDVEVLAAVLKGTYPSLLEVAPNAPPELVAICERALAKDVDQRYQTAAALQDDLERYLGHSVAMREVSEVTAEIFAKERALTRSTIDVQVARMTSLAPTDKLPSLLPVASMGLSSGDTSQPSQASSGPNHSMASGVSGASATPGGAEVNIPPPAAVPSSGISVMRQRLLIGFGILGLVGIALVVGARLARTDVVVVPTVDAGVAPTAAPTTTTAAAAVTAEPPPPTTSIPAAPNTAGAIAARDDKTDHDGAKAGAAAPAKPHTWWTPPVQPKQAPPAPRTAAPSAVVSAPDTRSPDPPEDKKGTGYLTIDTYPWTRVSLGGRVLGDTPLVRVALPVGTHVITLENSSENVRQTTVVQIKAGETVSRRLAF